jgi:ArsR family transcriptional regulator, arsenate/arsenite/antimonite-responsive transcriptional repressor
MWMLVSGPLLRYTVFNKMDCAHIERISKALADRTRLLIFEAISNSDEMNCGEIVSLRGVTPATVSHHLKILADAGLIESYRRGQFVYSCVNRKTLAEYSRALSALTRPRKK